MLDVVDDFVQFDKEDDCLFQKFCFTITAKEDDCLFQKFFSQSQLYEKGDSRFCNVYLGLSGESAKEDGIFLHFVC